MKGRTRNPGQIVNCGHRLIAPAEIRFEMGQFLAPGKRLGGENHQKNGRAPRHDPAQALIK